MGEILRLFPRRAPTGRGGPLPIIYSGSFQRFGLIYLPADDPTASDPPGRRRVIDGAGAGTAMRQVLANASPGKTRKRGNTELYPHFIGPAVDNRRTVKGDPTWPVPSFQAHTRYVAGQEKSTKTSDGRVHGGEPYANGSQGLCPIRTSLFNSFVAGDMRIDHVEDGPG